MSAGVFFTLEPCNHVAVVQISAEIEKSANFIPKTLSRRSSSKTFPGLHAPLGNSLFKNTILSGCLENKLLGNLYHQLETILKPLKPAVASKQIGYFPVCFPGWSFFLCPKSEWWDDLSFLSLQLGAEGNLFWPCSFFLGRECPKNSRKLKDFCFL